MQAGPAPAGGPAPGSQDPARSARSRRGARGPHAMEGFYGILFALLTALCLVLEWPRAPPPGKAAPAAKPAAFKAFRNNYLFVYSLMMGASQSRLPAFQPRGRL